MHTCIVFLLTDHYKSLFSSALLFMFVLVGITSKSTCRLQPALEREVTLLFGRNLIYRQRQHYFILRLIILCESNYLTILFISVASIAYYAPAVQRVCEWDTSQSVCTDGLISALHLYEFTVYKYTT